MNEQFHPFTLGEVLDRTFQIYRSRFLVFLGIATAPALAMMALIAVNEFWWRFLPETYGRRAFLWFTPQMLLYRLALIHADILFHLLFWPAFARAASECALGHCAGVTTSLSPSLARWKNWLGLTFVNWSCVLILPELVIGGLLAGTAYALFEIVKLNPDDPWQLGPKMFLASLVIGWVLFQWISAIVSLSVPVWTLESLGIRAALRRSWGLSKGTKIRLIAARILPACLGEIVSVALSWSVFLPLYFVLRHTAFWLMEYRYIVFCAATLIGTVASALVGPLFPIALTLLYYDQRMRREGYDIERMMEAAGMSSDETQLTGREISRAHMS